MVQNCNKSTFSSQAIGPDGTELQEIDFRFSLTIPLRLNIICYHTRTVQNCKKSTFEFQAVAPLRLISLPMPVLTCTYHKRVVQICKKSTFYVQTWNLIGTCRNQIGSLVSVQLWPSLPRPSVKKRSAPGDITTLMF
jgi:hypothetical protein